LCKTNKTSKMCASCKSNVCGTCSEPLCLKCKSQLFNH
jgi:hypothetical protein